MSDVRTRPGHHPLSTPRPPLDVLWDGQTRGSEVAALAAALTLTAAAVEITLVGHLRLFFDLCFVTICLLSALLVRPRDFFTVAVLPPLLMFATMVIVALNGPKVIAHAQDSTVQAVVTGLAHHSVALFTGYAVCLLALLARQRLGRR
ncbi:MAG TPA: DUF6542 domain-containing protein [Nocardioides sp.]|nr:DUF6542 domain-containing protein [Nocardioides sp.]